MGAKWVLIYRSFFLSLAFFCFCSETRVWFLSLSRVEMHLSFAFFLHCTFVQWKGRSRESTDDLLSCSRFYNDFLFFIAPSLDLLRLSSQLLMFCVLE